jgi:hypothetical protein
MFERKEFQAIDRSDHISEIGIRPTLFIGLGGTGHRIGVHLKAIFQNRREECPDWLRLLVFDTADEPFVARMDDGRTVHLEPGTEFVNIGRVPVGRIVRHREKQRAIAERFGDSLTKLPPTVLRHGAKQVRLLGLLALYWHFHQVEDHLQQVIWHLAGREIGRQTVVEGESGLNVFIANSLCGGTGAGTFLDLAFLVRALVEELGNLGDFCQVTGLGVLPGAFPNVSGPYLLPNTVASLMELNHAMTHRDFQATYPNGRVVEQMAAPFNLYYVIDGVDERGRVWKGISAVCRQAARALYLQIGSQLGRKGENDFDNLDEILGKVTEEGVGTFLGSVGLSVCRFDADRAHRECARLQALRLIREGWLKAAGDASGNIDATFWETARLDPDTLMDDLAIDEEGVPITVDLTLPGHLRQLSPQEKAHETVGYVVKYRSARLEGSFRSVIEARRKEHSASAEARLQQEIMRLVKDPESGVKEAIIVLDALGNRLGETRAMLQGQQEKLEGQIEQLDGEMKRRCTALLRAPKVGFLGRERRVKTAQRHYLQAATAVYRASLSRDLCNAALQILDGLARRRARLTTDLGLLTSQLRSAAQLLTVIPEQGNDGLLVDLELANETYVTDLYARHAPSLRDTAALCLNGGGEMLDWAKRPASELARWIQQRTSQAFGPLLRYDVESALEEQSDEVSPEARRLWLLDRATPSWNLDRSRMREGGAGLVSVTVLGVPDEHQTLFAGQSETLVSTQDDHRIVALRATVGAPYTALQRFHAWKRAYERKRGQRGINSIPLHVLPSFHTSRDAALQAFAVGLVFQFIFSQGSWYYYRPADQLDEPQRLAQGLHNAVRSFAAQEGLAREVLERVDQHISMHLTTAQAIERLDTYCTAGKNGEIADELDRRLRKAARAYADRLRGMLAASEGVLDSGE